MIYGFLFFGYGLKRWIGDLSVLSKSMAKYLMVFLAPVVILNSFWSIEFRRGLSGFVPIVFIVITNITLIPAILTANMLKLSKPEKGSFISCTIFSNVGLTMGGILCFMFYGDRGLYISGFYLTLFIPYYYLIGFPLMSVFSNEKKIKFGQVVRKLIRDPVSIAPISTMCTGLALNLAGIPRPDVLNEITTRLLVYIAVAGYSLAIGMGLSFSGSIKYIKHSLYISAIKFVFTPLIGLVTLAVFGFLHFEDSLPAKVIFVESFMPTAIMSVLLVKIFNLNEDLSNASWILTNMFAVPVIPVIWMLQKLI
jgi:predicted permease